MSPYPLDDGPVAWRCERAGGWGLAANVSSARAGYRSSSTRTNILIRTVPRAALPAPFLPVHLGEAPLLRVSRPPRISPNSLIYVTEKLSKNPAGRRHSSPSGTKTWGCQNRAETGGSRTCGFGKAGRCVRTVRQWREQKTRGWRETSEALPTKPTLQ